MRTGLLLAIPGLALLLLAAHLLHGGLLPLAVLAILLAGLLWVRRPWAARVVQVVLLLAAVEWAVTAFGLAQMRLRHGEPYLRLVLILGAVTAFTLLAAYVFQRPRLRAWFGCPVPGTPTFQSRNTIVP
jgi:4-amino-4-deoxy-L-arabinose transferase-like glycosyltransferase